MYTLCVCVVVVGGGGGGERAYATACGVILMKFAEVGFVNQCKPSMLVMHNKYNSAVTRYFLS